VKQGKKERLLCELWRIVSFRDRINSDVKKLAALKTLRLPALRIC
jgi:hypothetical protein